MLSFGLYYQNERKYIMPFLDIRSSKPIDGPTRNKLQLEIGKLMPIIPGKNVSNTLICISDNYAMYKDAEAKEAIFVDVRLYKNSPEESKKEFAKEFTGLLETVLGIPPSAIQMNFVELPNWAVNGEYF